MWKTRTSNSSVHRAETVWKLHQSISFLGMYPLLTAVYVHFYCFIDLAINSHTKPSEFDFEESVLSLDYPCPGGDSWKFQLGSKSIPFGAAHIHMAFIREYSPPPLYTPTGLCIVEITMYVYFECTVLWLFFLTIFFFTDNNTFIYQIWLHTSNSESNQLNQTNFVPIIVSRGDWQESRQTSKLKRTVV